MGSQSVTKTIFLLSSMVVWLIVGAALMYLFPFIADQLIGSDQTHLWMTTLSRGSYNPTLGWTVEGIALGINVVATLIWYSKFEGKV
ncbi:hypothetical protein IQ250_27675 [Pseudanabaenaceae cyanobacterium LEGE 13415]|nr:hypothetical protein [Pseudanabaenaceae cyanobacterium LEGE 13415]